MLVTELGRSMAASMAATYAAIVKDMRAAGLKPASLSVRHADRGSGFSRTGSGCSTPRSRPAGLDDSRAQGLDSWLRPWRRCAASRWQRDGARSTGQGRFGASTAARARSAPAARVRRCRARRWGRSTPA